MRLASLLSEGFSRRDKDNARIGLGKRGLDASASACSWHLEGKEWEEFTTTAGFCFLLPSAVTGALLVGSAVVLKPY